MGKRFIVFMAVVLWLSGLIPGFAVGARYGFNRTYKAIDMKSAVKLAELKAPSGSSISLLREARKAVNLEAATADDRRAEDLLVVMGEINKALRYLMGEESK